MNYRIDPQYLPNVFTSEECDRIVSLESLGEIDISESWTATPKDVGAIPIRKSYNGWIKPDNNEWIYEKMTNVMTQFNDKCCKLDVRGWESFQYTVYKEVGDFYDWHVDHDTGQDMPPRKISLSLQLTDPSEYEFIIQDFMMIFLKIKEIL